MGTLLLRHGGDLITNLLSIIMIGGFFGIVYLIGYCVQYFKLSVKDRNYLSDCKQRGFDEKQRKVIEAGLRAKVDVRMYSDLKYTDGQMFEILEGLKDNLDVTKYANPALTWEQMHDIRLEFKNKDEHTEIEKE